MTRYLAFYYKFTFKKINFIKVNLLLCCLLCGQITLQATEDFTKVRLSLQIENATLEQALQTIETKTKFKFVYSSNQVNKNRLVKVKAHNQTLLDILKVMFEGQSILFYQQGQNILIQPQAPPPTERKTPPAKEPKLATGTLRGKIIDELTNEPLPGASIVLKGTTKGTASDLYGDFQLSLIPEGPQIISVSYLGYQMQEVTVNILADQVVSLNIKLKSNPNQLGEIVVKGSLEGQEKALNQQKTADNIKNIISADLIGRFPDLNVAEALQRIPGINIERDRGEGGEVQLRGAPPSFTTININGEQIPGTQPSGQRNEELSLIPVDQLSSIEVTKAITSDQDGDNIGGTVDLRTPTAKGLQAKYKLEVGGGYNNIVEKLNFIGKFGYNQRFAPSSEISEGRLGIAIGGSYFASDNGRDRTQYQYVSRYTPFQTESGEELFVLPNYYRLRDLENQRTRTGLSATIDYKFNSRHSIFFNTMYSRRFDADREKRVQYNFNTNNWIIGQDSDIPNFNNNTVVRRFVNPRENDVNNLTYSLGGEHLFGKVTLDYLAFVSDSRNSANLGRSYDFRSDAVTVRLDDFYTDFTNVSGVGFDVHNPLIITAFNNYVDQEDIIESLNTSFKANVSIPYLLNEHQGLFKFGAKYRTISNNRRRIFDQFDFLNDGSLSEGNIFSSVLSNQEDQQFMLNQIRLGPNLDVNRTDAFINANQGLFNFNAVNSLAQSLPQFYNAHEDVYAAYVMSKLTIKKLMFLAGFRYERTDVTYDANRIVDGDPQVIGGGRSFNFFLPNFHAKYSLDNLTNIRAALTWSFARSSFVDLVPFQLINLREIPLTGNDPNARPIGNISEGNVDLLPARAINFDILFERYFSNVGIISGGVFFKRINDFNFSREFTETREFTYVRGDGVEVTGPVDFNIEQTQNGDFANIYGAEINLQSQLDFLPGVLSGIGVFANYTFTHSNANTFERENIRLPGQAQHTGNFALSYEYKGFSGRIAFNFNGGVIRSLGPDVITVGNQTIRPDGDFDTWRADRYQIDLQASYNIWKGLRVYAEFINLTNRPELEYFGRRSRPSNIEYFDWWNRFGVSYSF